MAASTPQPPRRARDRVKNFLGWAFAISLGLHLVGGPLIPWKQAHSEEQQVEKVSVTKKIKVKVPTPPPPTPTPPPPTPPPHSTPPPVHSTKPPPPQNLKVQPPKTNSNSANTNSSEKRYDVKSGSQSGVPQGVPKAPPAAPAAAPARGPVSTPPPTPPPTPKVSCAVPNSEAVATNKYQPETPEIAKEAGATGTAEVMVSLSASGTVTNTGILKSTGNAALDDEAKKAARQSSYAPKKENCVPVAGDYKFVVEFQ